MIWLGWADGISTIVGYLMLYPFYTYDIYDFVGLAFIVYQPLCRLFNAKSFLCIKYIWFSLVRFYGILTIVGYLMPFPLYTYILNILGLVWLGFLVYQPV